MRVAENERLWYVADFETTTLATYEEEGCTRVWLWSISDPEGHIVADGSTIDEFMAWCEKHHSSLIYFHNLKFDGSFIIWYLYSHQFEYCDKLLSHSSRGFSTLIGDMGEFYEMKVNFAPNRQVVFRDSLKIIPLSVREIAKAFKLPMEKGKIDYSDYTINEETLSYVHRDVQIVAMAMKFFRDKGYTRMTIGSNSYHDFQDNGLINKGIFPRLSKEWILEWRSAYRGGRTQVNPLYAGEILHNVNRYDINSMYPYVLAYMPMPYGRPIECEKGTFQFEIYDVDIHFKLKKNHLPTLLKNHSLYNKAGDTDYTDSETKINLKITSVDLMLLERHYDIFYIKYNKIVGFKTSTVIFRQWVKNMYALKSSAVGGLRLVYKLLLNSLYGKFGSKPEGRNKIPTFTSDGYIAWEYGDVHDMSLYYLPVALAVVSWAHKLIDDAIVQVGYENFIYCDTDSVHTYATLPPDMVDQKELGKFKLEATESVSKYIRQKTYIYKDDDGWSITCAGMPQGVKDYLINTYGEDVVNIFAYGLTIDESTPGISPDQLRLLPKQVKGGTILTPHPFSIR